MNPAQSSKSTAPQNMRHSNIVQMMFARAFRKKSVTQSPRSRFQISFVTLRDGLYSGRSGIKRQLIFLRQPTNKFFVAVRRRPAKFVIEMQHAQRNPQFFFNRNKQ